MLLLRHVPPCRAVLLLFGVALLSGCAALNPLQGVQPGPDAAWSRPGARPAHAAPTAGRPAPAASSAARSTRGAREAAEAVPVSVESGPSVSAEAPVLAGASALAQHLRAEGESWIGTPYRYGGQSRSGMDCSGFVGTLMREALGVALTRSTATMVYEGVAVDKDDLLPGDLVFFRRGGTRHVGVYLGDSEFIHASSSNGVIVSRLDEDYYARHYWTARRVLDEPRRFLLAGHEAVVPTRGRTAPAQPVARPAEPFARPSRRSSRSAW